jgi:RimJ/RimL family protein N-acetyltransferase
MTGSAQNLMLAAEARGEFVAHIIVRDVDREAGTGDLGIALDPARIGRGLGRRVLRELFGYLREHEGLTTLTLDVAGYNRRALRAYRAAGFAEVTRRFIAADMPIDFPGLLRDPQYEWLAPHVELSGGSVKIEVLSMRAHLGAALEVEGQV